MGKVCDHAYVPAGSSFDSGVRRGELVNPLVAGAEQEGVAAAVGLGAQDDEVRFGVVQDAGTDGRLGEAVPGRGAEEDGGKVHGGRPVA